MGKEKFIPLNNYVLFKEVEGKKSKYEVVKANYADRVPRGKTVATPEIGEASSNLQEGDEFLYRRFQEIPKLEINGEEFSLIGYDNVYGKFEQQ